MRIPYKDSVCCCTIALDWSVVGGGRGDVRAADVRADLACGLRLRDCVRERERDRVCWIEWVDRD